MSMVNCGFCKRGFYAKPSWIKNGYGKYCSQKCNHASQKNGQIFTCSTCGQEVYRSIKDQRKSKSGEYFCDKSCQTIWRNSIYVGNKHPNWKHGENVYRNILKRTGASQVCAKCKDDDSRVLAVHHKDKDRHNNTPANLIWLCHNCHFLVHHYKNEAKGFLKAPLNESGRTPSQTIAKLAA